MRAQEIISEAEVKPYVSQERNADKIMATLQDHCSEAMTHFKTPLWRGMSNHDEQALYINTTNSVRKSQNLCNHYTELMDNSPYFKNFPNRSKSLIASTSQDRASGFTRFGRGNVYALFPFNGTTIGVCPDFDIWETPIQLLMTDQFGNQKLILDTDFGMLPKYLQHMGLPETFKGMAEHVKTDRFVFELGLLLGREAAIKQRDSFLNELQKSMSPEKTGFTLITTATNLGAEERKSSHEVWFSGKCIAIQSETWIKIYREMSNL